MEPPFDKPFEQPIEFARALLEKETFQLPDLPVGPTPEPAPKPKVSQEEQAAEPVETAKSSGELTIGPTPGPVTMDVPELPINKISTEPAMELEMVSPPEPSETELPLSDLPQELEAPLKSPTGFGSLVPDLPTVAAQSPDNPELPVEVPQVPPEAGRFIPELEIPPTPPKPVSLSDRRAEFPLPTNLPEIFSDQPLPPPTEPGFTEQPLEPPKVLSTKPADFDFPPFPPIDTAFTEQMPMKDFEEPDNTYGVIREQIDRETLFINFGRD